MEYRAHIMNTDDSFQCETPEELIEWLRTLRHYIDEDRVMGWANGDMKHMRAFRYHPGRETIVIQLDKED